MKQPWHRRDPNQYACEKAEVRRVYPQLHFFPDDTQVSIRGGFPVVLDGKVLDRYLLEMIVSGNYPKSIPLVSEIGGSIPRVDDRHVDRNGNACLFLAEETTTYFPPGATLLTFLQGPVNSFLIGQLHFAEFGSWPFGQRPHGLEGIIEFYSEKLEISDRQAIIRFVDYLRRRQVKGHWECPCGKGQRLRNCHLKKLVALHKTISRDVAERSYERLSRE